MFQWGMNRGLYASHMRPHAALALGAVSSAVGFITVSITQTGSEAGVRALCHSLTDELVHATV